MSGYIAIGRGYSPFNGGGGSGNDIVPNPKAPCEASPLSNINITNPGTAIFDGYTASNGDRILLQAQTLLQQNGIYIFNGAASPMTRSSDANTWSSLVGATTYIQQGDTYQGFTWRTTILAGGTINVNDIPWVIISQNILPIGSKTQLGILQVGTFIDVNSGIINLPQSITTTADPLFSALQLTNYLYLQNATLPITPIGGGKLYSKLLSGDSNLFFLDSAGTEHQLTNGSATGYWNRVGTTLVPVTLGDNVATPAGNMITGSSGSAGYFQAFPITAAKGSLIIAATNNTGNTNTTITNSPMGQISTISIPDPGVSTANFILSASPITQTITTPGSVTALTVKSDRNQWQQFKIINSDDMRLFMGVDTATLTGGIFATNDDSDFAPLLLNPLGNKHVGIGSNGSTSSLIFYPPTINKGYLQFFASNSTSNSPTLITNADIGQLTTITIPDPGASTANFILSSSLSVIQTINSGLSILGKLSSPTFTATGITGAPQTSRYAGATTSGSPISGTFNIGDYIIDLTGKIWICITSGTPGTWTSAGNTYTASNGVLLTGFNFTLDSTYSPSFVNLTLTGISGTSTLTGGTSQFNISSAGQLNIISASQINLTSTQINTVGIATISSGQLYMNDSPIYVAGSGNPYIKLNWNNTNDVGIIDSLDGIGGSKSLFINPTGGAVGIGFPTTHTFTQLFEISGSSITNGNVFVKSDSPNAGSQLVVQGTTNPNKQLLLGFDTTNNVSVLQSIIQGSTFNNIILNPDGGLVGVGFLRTDTLQSRFNIINDMYFQNTTTPGTPTGGGKLYSKLISGDSNLFFLDSGGTEHQLTNGIYTGYWNRTGTILSTATAGDTLSLGSYVDYGQIARPTAPTGASRVYAGTDGNLYAQNPANYNVNLSGTTLRVSTAVDVNAPSDQIVGLDSTSGANVFNIDINNLTKPLTIVWIAGVSTPSIIAAAGQTINGNPAAFPFANLYTTFTIGAVPGSATKMFFISNVNT